MLFDKKNLFLPQPLGVISWRSFFMIFMVLILLVFIGWVIITLVKKWKMKSEKDTAY